MKTLVVNIVVAAVLFAAALAGALAATGRLNHEGVANLPVLNRMFPPPAARADGEGDATAPATAGAPRDADSGAAAGAAADAAGRERLRRGRSVFAEGGGPGGDARPGRSGDRSGDQGGGQTAAQQDTGAARTPTETPGDAPAAAQAPAAGERAPPVHAAERDLLELEQGLARDRTGRYAPGGYFRFEGMPAGLSAAQLNEAWQRVQQERERLERRSQALDLREQELRTLAEDVARRQTELGRERIALEGWQARLDERIEQFREQVKLVRTDEVAGLKRNAQTLASFEPEKAAELIAEQWKLEAGQEEILKTLEFMDREALNAILAVLPNAMIREVLTRRLAVSREPVPASPTGR